ncbi:50S ribosomal protein L24e [Candidatus Woesearchaeota archaeon]|nr:50S ribosomal protein L24e [Candidatus Woesearchaeota archaeon]
MANCEFCGRNIEKGTGKIFVYKTGKMVNFCSSKCEKNTLKLHRNPKKFKWTLKSKKKK